jgi:hypothetical protein
VPTLKKPETSQINNLMTHLKASRKTREKKLKPKTSREREIINIKVEINVIKSKNTKQRINETKCWFF